MRLDTTHGTKSRAVTLNMVVGASWCAASGLPTRALGTVKIRGKGAHLLYRSNSFVREYVVNQQVFDRLLTGWDEPQRVEAMRLLSRMRLVNSRNRLSHALIAVLLEKQKAFIRTGNPAHLRPLLQSAVVGIMAQRSEQGGSGPQADGSRVSRVVRGASVIIGDVDEVALTRLCPSTRDVHRELVRDLVRRELSCRFAAELAAPLTDLRIAEAVSVECAVPVSRRTVALIRKDLGVPDYRSRARRSCYLTVTAAFSKLLVMTVETIREHVPRAPGVYEIRIPAPGVNYPVGWCPVIYIGSSKELRKRLLDQTRNRGQNPRLAAHIATRRASVRWLVAFDNWRGLERRIYQQFAKTFGARPDCNRMSP